MNKAIKWLLPIAGLALIALGIYTVFTPIAGIYRLAVVLGIVMLFSGISEIAAFCAAFKGRRSGLMLVSGILSALLGIWVIFGSGMYVMGTALPFIFGAWVMVLGIIRIVEAVMPRQGELVTPDGLSASVDLRIRFFEIIFGILALISGFFLLFHPLMAAWVVSLVWAVKLISAGCGFIALFFRISKYEGDV